MVNDGNRSLQSPSPECSWSDFDDESNNSEYVWETSCCSSLVSKAADESVDDDNDGENDEDEVEAAEDENSKPPPEIYWSYEGTPKEYADDNVSPEQKASQRYGMELQRQIEELERIPRPSCNDIRHLWERIEQENELYRRQFAWQMENSQ
uniref:Uncharacterized protein n=1 Tax=Angiostrongylus cantonensis TaxID=6313 RepID=A0A0K0CXH5_ANGCA